MQNKTKHFIKNISVVSVLKFSFLIKVSMPKQKARGSENDTIGEIKLQWISQERRILDID